MNARSQNDDITQGHTRSSNRQVSVRVFLSSTSSDLESYRMEVRDAVLRMGHHPVCMDDFVADSRSPLTKCVEAVRGCDVYVGIFAWRYGFVPEGQQLSMTEMEYLAANEAGLPVLAFLRDGTDDWPKEYVDEGTAAERIRALRDTLARERVVSYFKDAADLVKTVFPALSREIQTLTPRCRVVGCPVGNAPPWFTDRVDAVRKVQSSLNDSSTRLTCILGRPGIGKSSLLSKVCRQIEQNPSGVVGAAAQIGAVGIIYTDCLPGKGMTLSTLCDRAMELLSAPQAARLAARWRDTSLPLTSKIRDLLAELRHGLYVIVLDDFDLSLDRSGRIANPEVRTFLETVLSTSGHTVRMVATSQTSMALGECGVGAVRTVEVGPLPDDDAVALLRSLDPDGVLGLSNASDSLLREAARRCHGIPFALLRLAGLLGDDPTTSLEQLLRNQTIFDKAVLENLTAEQYRRLDRRERCVLSVMAVLHGEASAEAIGSILQPFLPEVDVSKSLRDLTRRLVVHHQRGEDTYALHPLDAAYAYSQLPDKQRWWRRASLRGRPYSRRLLHAQAAAYHRGQAAHHAERSRREDLHAALQEVRHLIQAGDYPRACHAFGTFDFQCLWLWGYGEDVAAIHDELRSKLPDGDAKAWSTGNLGLAYWSIGRFEEAQALCDEAIEWYRKSGKKQQLSNCLGNAALIRTSVGAIAEGRRLLEEALALDQRGGAEESECAHLCDLGVTHRLDGDFDHARQHSQQGLSLSRRIGYRRVECNIEANLGEIAFLEGDREAAEQYFRKGLHLAEEIGSSAGRSYHLLGLARCSMAGKAWRAGLEYSWRAYVEPFSLARHCAAWVRGTAHLALNERPEALKAFAESEDRCVELLSRSPRNYSALYMRALALFGLDRAEDAGTPFCRAFEISSHRGVLLDVRADLEVMGALGEASSTFAELHAMVTNEINTYEEGAK